MFKNMKIGVKILLVVLGMSIGTMMLVFVNAYISIDRISGEMQKTNIQLGLMASDDSKDALQAEAEEYLTKITQKQVLYSNGQLREIRRMIDESVGYIERLYASQGQFVGKDVPLPNQTVDGMASAKYMLAPGVDETDDVLREVRLLSNCEAVFGPSLSENKMLDNIYVGTESGISYRYSKSNLYNPSYDPREREWYKKAMENKGSSVWLDTYTDSYGNICITCARAFRDAKGNVAGVVASDIKLRDMLGEITSAKIGQTGYAFVIDDGLIIAHPDYFQDGFDNDVSSHVTDAGKNGNGVPAMVNLAGDKNGVVNVNIDGVDSYVAFSVLEETGWILCITIDKGEVIQPALDIKHEIDQIASEVHEFTQEILLDVMKRFIIFFVLVGIMVVMISFAVAGSITRPIQRLARSVTQIGEGEFDRKVTVESTDEVGSLAEKFNFMLDNLQEYINRVTTITAEKERIGAELDVSAHIQQSMLPSIFPPFPDREEFDIHAIMDPAKEVGGDFYDFFLVDKDHLVLVMADVSGKGVPAALFMVIAKTLLKNSALNGYSPKKILETVNNQLCENNEAEMFVTVWIGILTISTGDLLCANAGHEYPAIRKADGAYELLRDKHGFVLAGMEGAKYREYELHMDPGDALFVYTDGVTEATNSNNELFGTERMLKALNDGKKRGCKTLLETIRSEIDAFVGEAPQFDDITMLSIVYNGGKGKEGSQELVVPARLERLDEVLSFVHDGLKKHDCAKKAKTQLAIAVEEIFVNIAHYAYGGKEGTATIVMEFDEDTRQVDIYFMDEGTPYNPLEKPDPDITLSAEEREIGGLGIFMVKKSMDEVSYAYRDGKNILAIRKKI